MMGLESLQEIAENKSYSCWTEIPAFWDFGAKYSPDVFEDTNAAHEIY